MKKTNKYNKFDYLLMGVAFFAFGLAVYKMIPHSTKPTDPVASTVMITNMEGNSGGTGSIYSSSREESNIITNSHVCGLLAKHGGLVKTDHATYRPVSMIRSPVSDLCLVTVLSDLHSNEVLADSQPEVFSHAKIVGHPALDPTVVTYGHVSGRRILPVLIGFEPCTEDDYNGSDGILCLFLSGFKPVIKNYESVLVTATIMPGSSGSGVYDEKNRLIGLVFAGSGDLGYAWTVPYEQVVTFLNNIENYRSELISNDVDLSALLGGSKNIFSIKDVRQKCVSDQNVDDSVKKFCEVLQRDVVWAN